MSRRPFVLALAAALCVAQLACSVIPRGVSGEGDIEQHRASYGDADYALLVASRTSEFKAAVLEALEQDLAGESITISFIGLQDLRDEEAGDYDAVVLINTCIAWSLDPQVDAFLNRYRAGGNIIVLTTSGNGSWEPKKQNREFDTVASASEMARVDEVAGEIAGKVRAVLGS